MKMQRRFLILGLLMVTFLILHLMIWQSDSGVASVPPELESNVSRNTSDYVSEVLAPHILGREFCTEKKFLLVIVCSRPDSFETRRIIRETWGQKHDNVSFFFFLGEVVNDNTIQYKLENESIEFGDIIQERFVDSYNNLTLKSINILKLFKLHCSTTHDYLMKVDDDVFLNTPLFVKDLSHRKIRKNLLLGKRRQGFLPNRIYGTKWYMPYEWYPNDTYPDFLCGPAYVMSADIVGKLYQCALEIPLLHLEDVYLTGICAERMKIQLENSDAFTCGSLDDSICHHTDLYTLHYFTADDIRDSYQRLKNEYCRKYLQYSAFKKWILFYFL